MFEQVIVPCVPQRTPLRPALAAQIAREFGDLRCTWVEQPPDLPPSANIPRAFGLASGNLRRYILYIEDDAAIAVGARAALETDAKLCSGAQVVSYFSIRRRPGLCWERGLSFTVFVAVRADVALAFAFWYPGWLAQHPEHHHASDIALQTYAKGDCWTRYPSLAQHLPVPSALGPRSRRRQSPTYQPVAQPC